MKTQKRKYLFMQHKVILWNSLPHEMVEADSMARFKKGLDIHVDDASFISF